MVALIIGVEVEVAAVVVVQPVMGIHAVKI
jgi:hypothetical protein